MTGDDTAAERFADVLKLAFVDGLSVRAISRRLHMARKTVRWILDRDGGKRAARRAAPRPTLLSRYDEAIRQMLSDTPELKAPAILERLRPLGYQGGVSILRDRLRQLRPHAEREAFLTLDFAPGAAMQVDWADFGFALPGCPRREIVEGEVAGPRNARIVDDRLPPPGPSLRHQLVRSAAAAIGT